MKAQFDPFGKPIFIQAVGSKRGRRVLEEKQFQPQSKAPLKKRTPREVDSMSLEVKKNVRSAIKVGTLFDRWLWKCLGMRDSIAFVNPKLYHIYNQEINEAIISLVTIDNIFNTSFDIYIHYIEQIRQLNPHANGFLQSTIDQLRSIQRDLEIQGQVHDLFISLVDKGTFFQCLYKQFKQDVLLNPLPYQIAIRDVLSIFACEQPELKPMIQKMIQAHLKDLPIFSDMYIFLNDLCTKLTREI